MAQANEEVMGFAEPTLAERREEAVARAANLSIWLALNGPATGQAGLPREEAKHRACRSCGFPTGNWCDDCEDAGVRTRVGREGTMAGTPYCSRCERDDVQCTVCGV